jgi:hypothetical protein
MHIKAAAASACKCSDVRGPTRSLRSLGPARRRGHDAPSCARGAISVCHLRAHVFGCVHSLRPTGVYPDRGGGEPVARRAIPGFTGAAGKSDNAQTQFASDGPDAHTRSCSAKAAPRLKGRRGFQSKCSSAYRFDSVSGVLLRQITALPSKARPHVALEIVAISDASEPVNACRWRRRRSCSSP